jgi:hypothetical protein
MAALHVWRRLSVPAQESVDDLAKPQQIIKLAERGDDIGIARGRVGVGIAPVGPRGGNERSAAVRQNDEGEQDATPLDAAYHRQRLPLERMAFAGDGHQTWNIPEMGSLLYLPSTR